MVRARRRYRIQVRGGANRVCDYIDALAEYFGNEIVALEQQLDKHTRDVEARQKAKKRDGGKGRRPPPARGRSPLSPRYTGIS